MSRTKCRVVALVVLSVLLCRSEASAWGSCGHRIVGEIAAALISEKTASAVEGVLGRESIAVASLWADDIRDDPAYRWASPYHYVNVPVEEDRVDYDRDCPRRGCVLRGVEDGLDVLRRPGADLESRREALRFLIHYVGDLHQPLHVSHAEDRGGNSIEVEFFGRPTNLHSVWDTWMLEKMRRGVLWKTSCSKMARRLVEGLAPLQIGDDVRGDILAWADESLALARSHAYELPAGSWLDQAYLQRNAPVVEARLELAGQRLAALLDDVFGSGTDAR